MSIDPASLGPELRQQLLDAPDVILEDEDLMRALIAADSAADGANVVDLRDVAMDRLERRLLRLEETHHSVISAAYDNLTGTHQIHQAVLALIEHQEFDEFIRSLATEVTDHLRVAKIHLVLESADPGANDALDEVGDVVRTVEPGFVDAYMGNLPDFEPSKVVLRRVVPGEGQLYGPSAHWVASEACLRLDIGLSRYPAMLVLGTDDPYQFSPSQGADLMAFFGGAFERLMRRWLG
ncbi:MAG: DUF484 family protein [Pseudomonadota bacterium]